MIKVHADRTEITAGVIDKIPKQCPVRSASEVPIGDESLSNVTLIKVQHVTSCAVAIINSHPEDSAGLWRIIQMCIVISHYVSDAAAPAVTKHDRWIASVYADVVFNQVPTAIFKEIDSFMIWTGALRVVSVAATDYACGNCI